MILKYIIYIYTYLVYICIYICVCVCVSSTRFGWTSGDGTVDPALEPRCAAGTFQGLWRRTRTA